MPKTIPYGIGNYAELVEKNAYFYFYHRRTADYH